MFAYGIHMFACGTKVREAAEIAARWTRRHRRALLLLVAIVPLVLILVPVTWVICHIYFDRSDVPDLEAFLRFRPPTTGAIHDVRGEVLIELAHEYRRVVDFEEVPAVLRSAVLAAEDKNFFRHSGVEYGALPRVLQKAVVRSVSHWWQGDDGFRLLLPQGGSTLTQQLVRGYFLRHLTTLPDADLRFHRGWAPTRLVSLVLGARATNKLLRKLEEVRLALWLEEEMERRYGSKERAKREIFARYASFLYLGNGRYGFAAASDFYLGESLAELTSSTKDTANAALLASIGKAPRDYAPRQTSGNEQLLGRRNQILDLMARNGAIGVPLASRCHAEPIPVRMQPPSKTEAPAAVDHILDELVERGGSVEDLFAGRFLVHSTLDASMQDIVNEALEAGLTKYESRHSGSAGTIQGAVVVLRNADASILAEVGGREIYDQRRARYSDYNRATTSLRQPGSAIKPLVYLAALERGMTLDTLVLDEPISVDTDGAGGIKWIANYDNEFKGPIPMRQALAESRNAAAVWLTREIGVDHLLSTAAEMGIRTRLRPYLSTALGASEVRLLELANTFRAIAAGVLAQPYIIDRVIDASGDRLFESERDERPIRSAALRSIQEGLRGVVRLPDGTAHSLAANDFPVPVMGKTGTTSDFRDALFVGSTYGPEGITVAVRIGFDDNRPLGHRETGGRVAMPVFREIMTRLYQDDLLGRAPRFPREIEKGIDRYLAIQEEMSTASMASEVGPAR